MGLSGTGQSSRTLAWANQRSPFSSRAQLDLYFHHFDQLWSSLIGSEWSHQVLNYHSCIDQTSPFLLIPRMHWRSLLKGTQCMFHGGANYNCFALVEHKWLMVGVGKWLFNIFIIIIMKKLWLEIKVKMFNLTFPKKTKNRFFAPPSIIFSLLCC